jgi:hypothetical protein
MPFKSQAQRRKFAQLLVEGKISPETYEEWNRETGGAMLPDHVKRGRAAKGRKTAKARKTTPRRKAKKKSGAARRTAGRTRKAKRR